MTIQTPYTRIPTRDLLKIIIDLDLIPDSPDVDFFDFLDRIFYINKNIGIKEILEEGQYLLKKTKSEALKIEILHQLTNRRDLQSLKEFIDFLNRKDIEKWEEMDIRALCRLYQRFGKNF